MTWMLIFVVMAGAGVAIYASRLPGGFKDLVDQLRSAGTGATARPLDPKRLGDEIHRRVISGAVALPEGKYANTTVWVYLSSATYQRFGDALLTKIGDQVRAMVDKDLGQRKWEASGPTSVTWHVDTGLVGDEHVITLLEGNHTIADPDRVDANQFGAATQPLAQRASITVDGRDRDLPRSGTWIVGRGDGCDITVTSTDAKVSRRHFKLDIDGLKVTLYDTSVNGTLVNGVKSQQVVLRDRDTIELPDGTTMVFRLPDAVSATN